MCIIPDVGVVKPLPHLANPISVIDGGLALEEGGKLGARRAVKAGQAGSVKLLSTDLGVMLIPDGGHAVGVTRGLHVDGVALVRAQHRVNRTAAIAPGYTSEHAVSELNPQACTRQELKVFACPSVLAFKHTAGVEPCDVLVALQSSHTRVPPKLHALCHLELLLRGRAVGARRSVSWCLRDHHRNRCHVLQKREAKSNH